MRWPKGGRPAASQGVSGACVAGTWHSLRPGGPKVRELGELAAGEAGWRSPTFAAGKSRLESHGVHNAFSGETEGENHFMAALLGIDIGTSGVKTLAIDPEGKILASGDGNLPLLHPETPLERARPRGLVAGDGQVRPPRRQASPAAAGRTSGRSASRARCTAPSFWTRTTR